MDIKFSYRLISVFLLSLPLLSVEFIWNHLPGKLPVHFGNDRHPDGFSSREEWFVSLLFSLFFCNVIRALFLRLIDRQQNLKPGQYRALYLLSAGFVSGMLSLTVLQGIWQSPMYADWLPALFFLSASGCIYVIVPPVLADLPEEQKAQVAANGAIARRLAAVQHLHLLSRLVVVRVNLLVVVLMFFVHPSDRWTIGVVANVLAYAFVCILTVASRQRTG